MNLRSVINKVIIISFFVLAGFLLAKSLYYGSVMGAILAVIGIIAWTMFLYKLNSFQEAQKETEKLEQDY